MWRTQFPVENPPAFGLGFIIGQWRGRRTISHNGAIYGCSSYLILLPDEKLAVVVLANEDIVNGRTRHVAEAALSQLLEEKRGEKPPPPRKFPPPPNLAALAGDYESESFWARLDVRDGQLTGEISGQPDHLHARRRPEFRRPQPPGRRRAGDISTGGRRERRRVHDGSAAIRAGPCRAAVPAAGMARPFAAATGRISSRWS